MNVASRVKHFHRRVLGFIANRDEGCFAVRSQDREARQDDWVEVRCFAVIRLDLGGIDTGKTTGRDKDSPRYIERKTIFR